MTVSFFVVSDMMFRCRVFESLWNFDGPLRVTDSTFIM